MQEFYVYVQKGFHILVASMSSYIGHELKLTYRDAWWDEVLDTLSDVKGLPLSGSFDDLVGSLDVANCIRLLDRRWSDIFKFMLPLDCRTWAKELMGVRNIVAHIGSDDLEQPMAERALDTMALLCDKIDPASTKEIRGLYSSVRKKAPDSKSDPGIGIPQPESGTNRRELPSDSLLKLVGTDIVQKTALTRKVTYGGKTTVYPVYRIRLDALYYNDQNDRIATWITQYETENMPDALNGLDRGIYNRIIENFIYESNPESIHKTQKNIDMVGQREPGVALADGRIVDGNRRYTCLRRLQRERIEPIYFETVIMEMDIEADKKQIKLLELAIQHGEEKKVDYDLIDYAIGTYRDIVLTKLLSIDEYAASTNETIPEVKKRIEVAGLITEFLDYLKLPGQYHVAREYQVYSLFYEMMPPLHQLSEHDASQLKRIAFNNSMMKAIPDQRKFIRDIKSLIKNNAFVKYFEEQSQIGAEIEDSLAPIEIHSKEDIDQFADARPDITVKLQASMEDALQRFRKEKVKLTPYENVRKCIDTMMGIDPRVFGIIRPEDKDTLRFELDELARIVENFKNLL